MKRRKIKRVRRIEAEIILAQYRDLCLEKKREMEGYRISLKEAHKRVKKIRSIPIAIKFLGSINWVINKEHLQECFPYGQAFFHLKEMVIDKIEEMQKLEHNQEEYSE